MKKLISTLSESRISTLLAWALSLLLIAALLLWNPPLFMGLLRYAAAFLCLAGGIWMLLALGRYLFSKG